MALNSNSNGYTFGFAIVMVVVVGAVLSFAAIGLKPKQKENLKQEKMQNILSSIKIDVSRAEAADQFTDYVKKRYILNSEGTVIGEVSGEVKSLEEVGAEEASKDAFNLDVKKQYKDKGISDDERKYPLYECQKDGETYFVVPMVGTGLWGPIWGFIAFKDDMNTIMGAKFDHKTETPGLGAEINQASFQDQFEGETIFSESEFVSIDVTKGGGGDAKKHAVDGITGGTITSDGVQEMIQRTLEVYVPYFKKQKA